MRGGQPINLGIRKSFDKEGKCGACKNKTTIDRFCGHCFKCHLNRCADWCHRAQEQEPND
ncbi:MAG: hypothetical protein HY225_04010 [Candidatus Vogelbacteria bacterium]|nr:hypothetical protein [Candidatus Vogelbacteria bacterium]